MTPDEQVDHIVKMMLEGEWKGPRSRRELAAAWGCHERTVGDRAVSAAAVCRRLGGPVEDMVQAKLAELEHIAEVAMELQRPVVVAGVVELYPAPDVKAARQAVRDYLEVLGAFNHVKRSVELPPDEVTKMTAAEKIAAHKQAIAELEAEQANGRTNGVH